MKAQEIILEPIMTEKSYAGIPNKIYTFKVARVNTINCNGKKRVRNTRHGQVEGRTSDYKKAIVFLKEDSKSIAFFDSLN